MIPEMKKGFTLAELLISMTVIGVVAAIAIPQFVMKIQKNQAGIRLGKAVEQVEVGLQNMIQAENDKISSAGSYIRLLSGVPNLTVEKMAPYLGLVATDQTVSEIKTMSYIPTSMFIPMATAANANYTKSVYEVTSGVNGVDSSGFKVTVDVDASPGSGNTTNPSVPTIGDGYEYYKPTLPPNTETPVYCADNLVYNAEIGKCEEPMGDLGDPIPWTPANPDMPSPPTPEPDPEPEPEPDKPDKSDWGLIPWTGGGSSFTCLLMPWLDACKEEPVPTPDPVETTLKVYKMNNGSADIILPNGLNLQQIQKAAGNNPKAQIMTVLIDTNGAQNKPNTYGKDIFEFTLNNSGKLIPYGIDEYKTNCSDTNITDGRACSARVVADGFKIKY